MKKVLTFIVFLIIGFGIVNAQKIDPCLFTDFYLKGNMKKFENKVLVLESDQYSLFTSEQLYELVVLEYGLVSYYLRIQNTDKAERFLEEAFDRIDYLLDEDNENPGYLAMKGALYGLKISISSYQAMFLGPKSMDFIERGLALDKLDPLIRIEKGNAMFHAPEMFGGSKTEAIEHYQKAIEIWEKEKDLQCNWIYYHSLAVLGTYYLALKDEVSARKQFEKVLGMVSDYQWVKQELLPKLK